MGFRNQTTTQFNQHINQTRGDVAVPKKFLG